MKQIEKLGKINYFSMILFLYDHEQEYQQNILSDNDNTIDTKIIPYYYRNLHERVENDRWFLKC